MKIGKQKQIQKHMTVRQSSMQVHTQRKKVQY